MVDGRATKTCPDCAETVLAGARKCRFCGYRFDGVPGVPAPDPLGILRRGRARPPTVPEILAGWGVALDDEEGEPAFFHGTIDRLPGFILVTETRFRFVPVPSGRRAQRVAEEHLLSDLLRVHVERRRLRRVLFIEWRGSRTVVEMLGERLPALHDALTPHELAAPFRRPAAGH